MNKPKIRTHYQLKDLYLPPKLVRREQQAIPWCIAHNSKGVLPGLVCDLAQFTEFESTPCEISTGGPEHKWWMDL